MRVATLLALAALAWVSTYPALADGGAPSFKGLVLNVGSGKPNGVLRMTGKARFTGPMNLANAKLHLVSLLSERRGSLELVGAADGPLLPLHLTAKSSASKTRAVFESDSSPAGAKIRVTIARRAANAEEYAFSIQVQGALIAADPACESPDGTTERRSRFMLDDGINEPVRLQIRHLWKCGNRRLTDPISLEGEPPATPEQAIADMAFDLFKDVLGDQLNDFLFPNDIDYEKILENFKEIIEDALIDNDIQVATGLVTGYSGGLKSSQQVVFNAQNTPEYLSTVQQQLNSVVLPALTDIQQYTGELRDLGAPALAGWAQAANVLLNTYRYIQNLQQILDPTNVIYNGVLADTLDDSIQYLAGQRNAVLSQKILDSLGQCSSYKVIDERTGDESTEWQFTNCTGAVHKGYSSETSCENDALSIQSSYCAETIFDDATAPNSGSDGNVAWMEDVLDNWRSALAALNSLDANNNPLLPANSLPCAVCEEVDSIITVDEVLTGVRADVPVNTTYWLKAACDGQQTCDYQLEAKNFVQSAGDLTSVQVTYHCSNDPTTTHTASLAYTPTPVAPLFDGAYLRLDCAPRVTNLSASVRDQPVGVGVYDEVVTSGSLLDAARITDGITAPAGHDAKDTSYVMLLPHTGSAGALVIDLGALVHVCGNGFDCLSGPTIQADNDDVYQLDYSSDGVSWAKYGQFPTVSGSGLRTRGIAQITSGVHNPSFMARYLRVFGVSGGATYSVSELSLWDTSSLPISVGKPAWSNFVPLITNGQFAPEGTSWNSSTYAILLQGVGPQYGIAIDLGRTYGALYRLVIQADKNAYQVDVSTDGAIWSNWYAIPPVSQSGLRTRDSGPLPPVAGRYVRVYATKGDGNYSVSEMQVYANLDMPTCNGERGCGLSAATVLEYEPEGTAASDLAVSWRCGSDPVTYTTFGVPWTVSRSGFSYPNAAVVQPYCPPTTVTCTDPELAPTTCSHFSKDAEDAVVYMNAAHIPYQLSNDHPSCEGVISGKTNFYRTDSSTKNDPACTNAQRAIHDAIAAGDCPPGIGANANNSWMAWPYNFGIGPGSGATTTKLVDPAIGQPPLLFFLGCNSLLPSKAP
jgi:hypothetical protein